MNWAAIIWLIFMIGFLLAEAVCAFHLVSIWFAAGSLTAAVASMLGAQLWLQVTLFLVVSCVILALMWPFVQKFLNPGLQKTNIDSIIGTEAYVPVAVDNIRSEGQVKLSGMDWTARSASGDPIAAGTLVKVDRIEGVKAFVSEAEVSATV